MKNPSSPRPRGPVTHGMRPPVVDADPSFTLCGLRGANVERRTLAPHLVTCDRCRNKLDGHTSEAMRGLRQLGLFAALVLAVCCAPRAEAPVRRLRPAAELLCEPGEAWSVCFDRLEAVAPPKESP